MLVRRGLALARAQRGVVADAGAKGCEPVAPAEALDGDATDITVVITEEGGDRTARTSSIFRGPDK